MIYIMTFKILKVIKVKLTFKRQINYKMIYFQDFIIFKMYNNSKNTRYELFSIMDYNFNFFQKYLNLQFF